MSAAATRNSACQRPELENLEGGSSLFVFALD
jgi:hypothetical protein